MHGSPATATARRRRVPLGPVGRLLPLLPLVRPNRGLLVAAIMCGAANHLLSIIGASVGALAVGRAIEGATVDELLPLVGLVIVLIIPRAVTPWLESTLAHVMAFRTLVHVRGQVYRALERLAPAYLLERRSGDLGSTVIADVEALEVFFAHTLGPLVVALTVPFVAVAILAWVAPILAVALIPFLVLVATVPGWLHGRAERQGQAYRERLGSMNAEVVDGVQGLREVVVFGMGGRRLAMLKEHGARLQAARRDHGRRSGVERAAIDTLFVLGTLLVLGIAAVLVVEGSLAASLYPMAVVLAAGTFGPVAAIAEVSRDLSVVAAASARIDALLDEQPRVLDRSSGPVMTSLEPHVRFEGVTFAYADDLDPALLDVSFEIRPGESVALVGHSGAGKSTCAGLLLRFWDPDLGRIRIGATDLRSIPLDDLRAQVTLVPQDVYLFNESVLENLRLARPDASIAEVEAAARTALAHDFIADELPDGYATSVGERGARLSGGQRQRLAIARALLKDAPILVMDEAVSGLDAESEAVLATGMSRLRAGRTTLVIAHRLSTIRTADRIVVLERGRIVEQGTFETLTAVGGTFARLLETRLDGRTDAR